MGFIGTLLGRRPSEPEYRTIDGGHPAPYPDMTDEQLYNYEEAFKLPKRTFDRPPVNRQVAGSETLIDKTRQDGGRAGYGGGQQGHGAAPGARTTSAETRPVQAKPGRPSSLVDNPPLLDFARPVRTITTHQPVDIITTRARHPVYKVHGYIGDDQVVTVFTLEGQLSEGGPRFLENVPEGGHLYLNIYTNPDVLSHEKYCITQHASREEADAVAMPGRLACVPVTLAGTHEGAEG